jgi:hypothetical protein
MTVIATEGQFSRFSSLVKGSDTPENMKFFVDLVTVSDAAGTTLAPATVLGKVTATGNYVVSKQNAADGSQVPAAIYVGTGSLGEYKDTVLAAGTPAKVLVLARGKIVVAKEALKLDATFNDAAKKDAAYAALKAVGILVEASF